ncbi:hypothetical protein L1987_74253 [Smallanthus sonchifolius]|uniref:Uncharacterized protein n=1 Tax=Smallanthus sonchifolius TaxID=185202 RepID=A0ACB9A1G2_9ASTR|nr:hypothetical protein L1987_74253 [Smallanthus sonchifolius]
MHVKSRRHLAAESKLKKREEDRPNEMNKRISLSLDSTSTKQASLASKPFTEKTRKATFEATGNDVVQLPLDYRQRRERELKFTAAGWKRDCHGGWFRDENVEFDSDEEDPNECLANGK